MSRLIHLNGPPGIGKSTIARRYVDEHSGVLNCDIDVLRSLIGGWATDFEGAGALIRPAALAMIGAYLEQGHDVVLPQMLVNPRELARFEECALVSGATYVERFLVADVDGAVRRFRRRGEDGPDDSWDSRVIALVDARGGDELLRGYHAALERLIAERSDAQRIESIDGAPDATYRALVRSLQGSPGGGSTDE